MKKEYLFDDEFVDEDLEDELNELDEQDFCLNNIERCLTEMDFYPPSDNRVWTSEIEDIEGGDSFVEYCAEFFEMLDEEEYYDN